MSVFEFLQRDFISARFKILKNDLKFLGYQTIMRHFPTSEVTKEIKIKMMAVLKTAKTINWNTAFVDVSPKLVAVIKEYKDKHEIKPYKDLGNRLLLFLGQKYGENSNNRVRISNRKDLKSDSSEVFKLNTQNGNFYF